MVASPRTKVGYLLALSLISFFIKTTEPLAVLLLLQAALWAGSRLPYGDLLRVLSRLLPFSLVILAVFSLYPPETPTRLAHEWIILGWRVGWHQDGFDHGVRMVLRMLAVVSASAWVQRSSSPGDFVAGMRGWLLPESVAGTIAVTLGLLGSEPVRAGGRGDGGGGGRGNGRGQGALPSLRAILRGDVAFIPGMVDSAVARARSASSEMSSASLREDVAVLSGLCLLMLGTKLTRVLPGIPFAPGYKIAIILPLYFLAADRTRMPMGATVAGTALGVISFLFGDGRYGIFEILKHVAPGLVVDAAAPSFESLRGRTVPFILIAGLAAAARLSTVLAVVWFVDGNAALYAFAALQSASQLAFGAVSGVVAARLIRIPRQPQGHQEES